LPRPAPKRSSATIPKPGDVIVASTALGSIARGHPWIYRSAVVHGEAALGAAVRLVDQPRGGALGWGIWDPTSPIAVRVWTRDANRAIDARLFRERLEAALRIRARWFEGSTTTAYRILNGEGDRTPGFVLDRYADVAVLRIDGDAARAASSKLLADVEPVLRASGIATLLERTSRRGEAPDVQVRFGAARTSVDVAEHGVPFRVDLARGQKTGAFLDQRENRKRVGELVRPGQKVLNLFSYTGGFSLRAAIAGATVTSVDVAAAAHATAQESFRLAGADPRAHSFVAADAFAYLENTKRRGDRWDVVISDPPSFAPSEKAKPKGIAAYRALHRACAEVLAPNGTLIAASCSSHVSAEDFAGTLDDTALGRSDLRLLELHGPPADHPTLPAFPEGRYLKLAVLA
jgi:23S rRNA (cytosine1962-C5)-methyltransferase